MVKVEAPVAPVNEPGQLQETKKDDIDPNPIDDFSIEFLLLHASRDREVYYAVRQHLEPEHLGFPQELPYRVYLKALYEYFDKYNRLPNRQSIWIRVIDELNAMPNLHADVFKVAEGVMDWIFDENVNPISSFEPDAALDILRKVLVDRGPGRRLKDAVARAGYSHINDLPKLVLAAQKQIEVIETIGRVNEEETIPMEWDQVARPRWPTGVSFIDRAMEGGSEPGDVNVIIGATGGGKTTLSMQMAVSIARIQNQIEMTGDGEPGLVVFISYEDNRRMLQIRAVSCAAQVPKNQLRFMQEPLSTTGNLKSYEQTMYRAAPATGELLGERERLQAARGWLNRYMKFVDFHDGKEGGGGGVMEARQRLLAIQGKSDIPIRTVVLDWAGLMVRKHLLETNRQVDGSNMAVMLGGLVAELKEQVAAEFNCTVWLPHQLRGQATGRSPSVAPNHNEAEWCASFANMAWYAFCIGTKDKQHNVCQLVATKTRHGEGMPPAIVRVDGGFCKLTDVSDQFEPDHVRRQIVPRDDVANYHDNIQNESDDYWDEVTS